MPRWLPLEEFVRNTWDCKQLRTVTEDWKTFEKHFPTNFPHRKNVQTWPQANITSPYFLLSLSNLWNHGWEYEKMWVKWQEFHIIALRLRAVSVIWQVGDPNFKLQFQLSLRNFGLRLIAAWVPTLCARDILNGVSGCHLHSFILCQMASLQKSWGRCIASCNAPLPWIER